MNQQGLYRGIVVQNNDPQQSGRVKVYIPGINLNQSKNWNQSKEEDKFFKVMGGNTGSSLKPEVLNSQKERLLWAEVMLPVIGMSSPGFYNAPSDSFYIGNDSDYLSQESNKTTAAFDQDKQQSKNRPEKSPLPNYGQEPRTTLDLNFPINGINGSSFVSINRFNKISSFIPITLSILDVIYPSDIDSLLIGINNL